MSNMAHCRFRNTLEDLRDCYDHMDDYADLSEEEQKAMVKLLKLCENITENYESADYVIDDGLTLNPETKGKTK